MSNVDFVHASGGHWSFIYGINSSPPSFLSKVLRKVLWKGIWFISRGFIDALPFGKFVVEGSPEPMLRGVKARRFVSRAWRVETLRLPRPACRDASSSVPRVQQTSPSIGRHVASEVTSDGCNYEPFGFPRRTVAAISL